MEKEKRLREEKEERRKLQEAAERAREEARKAKGKSKFVCLFSNLVATYFICNTFTGF